MKKLLLLILLFPLFSYANHLIVGSGSGTVSVTSMGSLSAGDTILVTHGSYSGGAVFGGIHDVTIINYGGVVTFTATVDFGNSGASIYDITFTGTGDATHFYGFVFDGSGTFGTGPPGYPTGSGFRFTATTSYYIYMDHIYAFDLAPRNSSGGTTGSTNGNGSLWDLNVNTTTYNGTAASLKLQYAKFSYCKTYYCAYTYISGNYGLPVGGDGLVDSVDFSYDSLMQVNSAGTYVGGNIFRMHVHHNWILYSGHNTNTGDQGVFNNGGNGTFDHNYMYGGRGYLSRLFGCSITGITGVATSWAYDNIILATTAYAAFDWRSQSSIYYGGNPYLEHCNLMIVYNTVGNKTDDLGSYVAPIATVDNLDSGATIKFYGNVGFNLKSDGVSYIAVNYSNGTWLTYGADTVGNNYATAGNILTYLADTVNCFLKPATALINAGNPSSAIMAVVTTDFSGLTRPQGTSYDRGAREYPSSSPGCNCVAFFKGFKRYFVSK